MEQQKQNMGGQSAKASSALVQKVQSLISENKVMVFSKTTCPYCDEAKSILQNKLKLPEIKVVEFDLMESEQSEFRSAVIQVSQHKTVPVIYINQQFVGGCDDLKAKIKTGEIQEILAKM